MTTWVTPHTWVAGELVGASALNTHVRDNLNYLMNPNSFIMSNNSTNHTTTATTFATLTSTALVVAGGGPVETFAMLPLVTVGGAASVMVVFDMDGTQVTIWSGLSNTNPQSMIYANYLWTGLTVASHTFSLKWKIANALVTAVASGAQVPVTFYGIER